MVPIAQKKSFLKKAIDAAGAVGDGINQVASTVSNAVGGRDFVDYAGSKIAKQMVPRDQKQLVPDSTSGMAALKSLGKIGLVTGALAAAPAALPLALPVARGLSEGVLANPQIESAIQGSSLSRKNLLGVPDDLTAKLIAKYKKK